MQAYRIEPVAPKNRELRLTQLPFHPGEIVEIIVLSREFRQTHSDRFPLKDTVVNYEAPTEPTEVDDWAVMQ